MDLESTDRKIVIVRNAIKKYIITDKSINPNYRRGAIILKLDLLESVWDDIANYSSYFLCIIYNAMKSLYSENPIEEYENMLAEIDHWLDKLDKES
jgi:hypothetical protein